MTQAISNGIKISVETEYQPNHSQSLIHEHIFSYHISIENTLPDAIKLHSRHWHIFDSLGIWREVKGDGVVGLQPLLLPGEKFDYTSSCNLITEIGKMRGTYTMIRLRDKKKFNVGIPEFELISPIKMN